MCGIKNDSASNKNWLLVRLEGLSSIRVFTRYDGTYTPDKSGFIFLVMTASLFT